MSAHLTSSLASRHSNVLRYTIIDEADEMLTTGWEDTMERLFNGSGTLSR